MPSFFRKGDASKAYTCVRDSRGYYRGVRDRIEDLWNRYMPLCGDPKFPKKAMREFNACTWQMNVACIMLDHGHCLEPSGDNAPDIKIRQPDGSVLWVEVTTAEAGVEVRTDYSNPSERFDHQGRWTRPITPAVKTPKNIDAPTTGFTDGTWASVSAVIFSPRAIWNAPIPAGRECVTVYNATAAQPIAHDTFRFGESWHVDDGQLHPVDWWMKNKIATAAYYRWLARGGSSAPAAALDDWLAAEREIAASEE